MTSSHRSYMLDTTVFNHLLDGRFSLAPLAGRRLVVTGIQADELRKTNDPERRAGLLSTLEEVNPTTLPASSFALGIEGAGFGQAYWNDGSGTFEKMRDRLRELDSQQRKTKDPLNQERDILIAEASIKNDAILVSGDSNLRQVVAEFGGCAIDRIESESVSEGTQ